MWIFVWNIALSGFLMIKLQMLLVSKLHVPGFEVLYFFIGVGFGCKKALISQGQVILLNCHPSSLSPVYFPNSRAL